MYRLVNEENRSQTPGSQSQRFCRPSHVSAIQANNGTFKKRFKSQEMYKLFYELVVRLKDCSCEDAGVKLQDRLCDWLADEDKS